MGQYSLNSSLMELDLEDVPHLLVDGYATRTAEVGKYGLK
jgi:hypothetical protein